MEAYSYFSTVYDKMMDNIPYEEWEQYLLQVMEHFGVKPCSKLAELGCGTGTMSQLLAEDGFRVTGLDLSQDMLDVAAQKSLDAYGDGGQIKYMQADMRDFQLAEKQDVIVSICDSVNYLLTEEDLYKTFVSVRKNLKEKGVFIFDLKTEYFYEQVLDGRVYKGKADGVSYIWNNLYDPEARIHKYHLIFKDKHKQIREELHRQHVFKAADIVSAARKAGFVKGAAYDAFTFDKPKKCSERIYIVLRNSDS